MPRQPNFLLIITDQHRADYLGCYGHALLKTPHIDSIAARGTRFDRFYVATPVCMPNRATLMTGRMPSVHGVRSNGVPLSLRSNTFVDALRAGGYATALVGKSHLQNFTGFGPVLKRAPPRAGDQVLGAEFTEAMKPRSNDGAYDQELPPRWSSGKDFAMHLPFYGFEHVDLCTDHGDRVGGHYYVWLKSRRPDADALRDPKNQLPHDYICPQAIRTAIPEELYSTSYIANKACEWLDGYDASRRDAPFFLMVSFPDPHHPFTPPGRYWSMYRPEDMAVPPSFDRGNRPLPRPVAWAMAQRDRGEAEVAGQAAFAVNEREAREAMALSCGMIAMIDDAIGRVLARLAVSSFADDTVVIFTTDHGDFLGDHRLLLKGPVHYEGITRVPFIWAEVGARPARRTDALSGTLDIAPTILDRARIQPYNGMQGESLLPMIEGKAIGAARDSIVIEDDQQRATLGFASPPRLRSLITQRYRMTIAAGDPYGELYDRQSDPHEMDSLFDDPAHRGVRAELMELLAYREMELADRSPLPSGRA
ncbi:MAG TPA: sulfatase-like hydrolase/transferase [Xanthobacteraceae bacterium]|nr:sulfatase-like hydrolase/transferase [Xanthobacteraceae bacterium]